MKRVILAILFFGGTIGFTGCAPAFRNEVLRRGKAKGWSEEQQMLALGESYKYFLKKNPKTGKYEVNYSKLSKTHVREKLDELLDNIDGILSYKDEENINYVELFGLRNSLEHKEEVLKEIRDRVRLAELYDQFRALIGALPMEYGSYHARERISGYDVKQIFLSTEPASAFNFNVAQIEEAKRRNVLVPIEKVQFSLNRLLDRKEQNPANLDDPNNFIWKSKTWDIELTNYKILDAEKPDNNYGNYMEGYRVINGKRESKPALRVFFLEEGGEGVMLLDTDKEGDTGFGLPDMVEKVTDLLSVNEILGSDQLMNLLFQEKRKQQRIPPKRKPIFVEIVRLGDSSAENWEAAPTADGWIVPFKYRNELQSNYNIKVVFAKPDPNKPPGILQEVKYIKKEWTLNGRYGASIGRVVEYYRLKPAYGTKNFVEVTVSQQNTKRVLLVTDDGTEETVVVTPRANKLIEDQPVMVDYSEGQKRWRIMREGDSKVFNKRKVISPSSGKDTGNYDDREFE
ncbi:MAG: hypothetical protein HZB99_04785 [Candidatus Harrisonbacteria bacterium]|nr:hypothetical protein [Candidatus Harrisonbacteria bacterium]